MTRFERAWPSRRFLTSGFGRWTFAHLVRRRGEVDGVELGRAARIVDEDHVAQRHVAGNVEDHTTFARRTGQFAQHSVERGEVVVFAAIELQETFAFSPRCVPGESRGRWTASGPQPSPPPTRCRPKGPWRGSVRRLGRRRPARRKPATETRRRPSESPCDQNRRPVRCGLSERASVVWLRRGGMAPAEITCRGRQTSNCDSVTGTGENQRLDVRIRDRFDRPARGLRSPPDHRRSVRPPAGRRRCRRISSPVTNIRRSAFIVITSRRADAVSCASNWPACGKTTGAAVSFFAARLARLKKTIRLKQMSISGVMLNRTPEFARSAGNLHADFSRSIATEGNAGRP